MKKILISSFLVLGATAFAAGNTHKIEINQDSVIEGKTIKAGEYKLSLVNGNAVLKMGKETIEVPAHEATDTAKASQNELIYKDGNRLESVHLGGSNTKIVFEAAGTTHSGM